MQGCYKEVEATLDALPVSLENVAQQAAEVVEGVQGGPDTVGRLVAGTDGLDLGEELVDVALPYGTWVRNQYVTQGLGDNSTLLWGFRVAQTLQKMTKDGG